MGIAAVALCLVAGAVVVRDLGSPRELASDVGEEIAEMGVLGPLVFALAQAAAAVVLLPGPAFALAAGALFGPLAGAFTALAGATLGAALTFAIGRRLARRRLRQLARGRPRFEAIDAAVRDGGWKVVALLRLSALVPNYFFGLIPIGFWTHLAATFAALAPGAFVLAYAGHVGGEALAGERSWTAFEWLGLGLGLACAGSAVVYVARLTLARLSARSRASDCG